jgi:hypothetical protein
MPENTSKKNISEDEIDLLELFRRMGKTINRWGHSLERAFLISVIFILKRWLPLGLSIISGVMVSYFVKIKSDSSFTSELVFRNNLALMDGLTKRDNSGTTSEIISKINKLHIFCQQRNSADLSNALVLNPESVNNILDISAFWIIDNSKDGIPDYVDYKGNHSPYDTNNIRMQDRLDIRVRIKAPQELNSVRDGIIKFIENDSLYQQRNRLRLNQNRELLARTDYDILQLDSLQKVKYFEETRNSLPKIGGQMIFLQEQKTQLFYGDIYLLYSRKQALESEIDLYRGIMTLLSDFSAPAKRDNGTLYYGKIVIPIFFGLTLLILILVANRRKLKEIYNKY